MSGEFENQSAADKFFMRSALEQAQSVRQIGEIPIGACLVGADGKILASAGNLTRTVNDPTAHAEILVLRYAAAQIENFRLTGTTLYTTIEPCVMCAGAIVNARVARLVFGAADERFGAVVSKFRLCDNSSLNHRLEIVDGILEEDCRAVIQDFFRRRRIEKKSLKDGFDGR